MKKPIRQFIQTLVILLSTLFLSYAAAFPAQPYKEGSIIDLGYFTVIGPSGDDWSVNIQKDQHTVEFIKRIFSPSSGSMSEYIMIRVLQNLITNETLMGLSEEEVADDFRAIEEADMLMKSLVKEIFEVTDLNKDSVIIGEKKLYSMSYRILGVRKGPTLQRWINDSVLYLFFPDDFIEKHFFYCFQLGHLFIQGTLEKGDLTPIIPVINSLTIK